MAKTRLLTSKKKIKKNLLVTPSFREGVKEKANALDISVPAVIEFLIRSALPNAIAYYKASGFTPRKGSGNQFYRHGEAKSKNFSVMITEEADRMLIKVATSLKESQGEILECAFRSADYTLIETMAEKLKKEIFTPTSLQINNECPSCGSSHYWLSGEQNGKKRFKCKNCGRQFAEYYVKTGNKNAKSQQKKTRRSKTAIKGYAKEGG